RLKLWERPRLSGERAHVGNGEQRCLVLEIGERGRQLLDRLCPIATGGILTHKKCRAEGVGWPAAALSCKEYDLHARVDRKDLAAVLEHVTALEHTLVQQPLAYSGRRRRDIHRVG